MEAVASFKFRPPLLPNKLCRNFVGGSVGPTVFLHVLIKIKFKVLYQKSIATRPVLRCQLTE